MLTPEQVAAFHERGYVVVRGLVDAETMARLSSECEGLHEAMAQDPPPGVGVSWEEALSADGQPRIRQLMHSEVVSPTLQAISCSDALLDILTQLMGDDVWLYHSKLMMKPARDGSFTPWHQDFQYWQYGSREPRQVNCMLAIDPNIEANGALRFVVGSHKEGLKPHATFASKSFNIGFEGGLDAFPSTMVELQPGDAVFFGALVIHGSAPNHSELDRRANTFAFDVVGNQKEGELPERNWRRGRRSNQDG